MVIGCALLAVLTSAQPGRVGAVARLAAAPACVPAPASGASKVYALADHTSIYFSANGAGGWHTVSTGLPPTVGVYTVGLDSVSSAVLYAGTTGQGIYKTLNGGGHWFSANDESIATTYVYAMAVNPRDNTRVYAAGDNAVYRSLDGGLTWEQGNIGLPSFLIYTMALDTTNPDIVYVGTDSAGVYRSDSYFDNWTPTGPGLPVDTAVRALVADPAHAGVIYAGTDAGLFETSDAGGSWQPAGNLPAGQPVLAVALAPNNTQVLYAGTARGLYRSMDGGVHWTPGTGPLGTAAISALAIDAGNADSVYAASHGAIWHTANGGGSWAIVNQGMRAAEISVLAVFHASLTPTSPCLPPSGSGNWHYFAQTGHSVAGPFLAFYNAHGGQAVFGLPRTEAIQEPGVGTVQYFENSRLDLKNGTVQIAPIGDLLTTSQQPFPKGPPTSGTPQHPFFQLGGRNVSDLFLRFWKRHGGAALLGMPISDELHQLNDDGTGIFYQVQFFDNARLEYHPELHGNAVVQLGKLGDALLRRRGWL
jgi:photosystem II stability/assembly factor-like uncharacterized protein